MWWSVSWAIAIVTTAIVQNATSDRTAADPGHPRADSTPGRQGAARAARPPQYARGRLLPR